jgi:hypothetical protein
VMNDRTARQRGRKAPASRERRPAEILDQAIDLLLEMIEDGRQRLDEAGSISEWVKLAGALGQAETRLAQLLGMQAKTGGEKSDFEQALMQAIREWHERKSFAGAATSIPSRRDPARVDEQKTPEDGGQGR